MITLSSLLMLGVLCAGNPIYAQPSPTNSKGTKFTMPTSPALTNWCHKAGYGVCTHFLPDDGESLRKVEKFDGCYRHVHFNDAIADIYNAAVKHGNPRSIVAFNPGVQLSHYSAPDTSTCQARQHP